MSHIVNISNEISCVIPCFNEQENCLEIYRQLREIMPEAQLVFIDDGSSDNTWNALSQLASNDKRVKSLRFTRNFGHQAALEAGLRAADAKAVITIDADLQHPVNMVPKLIELWRQGNLIVNTKRLETADASTSKGISSSLYYRLFNAVSDIKIEEGSSDFRLLDRKVVDFFNQLPQRSKFFRGLVAWTGFKSATLEFVAPARISGVSGYSFSKMFELARLGITYFSYLPLKLIVVFGLALSVLSTAFFILTFICKFVFPDLFSSAALFGSFILANSGLIIVVLGVIALYQINLFRELQGLPAYVVAEEVGD